MLFNTQTLFEFFDCSYFLYILGGFPGGFPGAPGGGFPGAPGGGFPGAPGGGFPGAPGGGFPGAPGGGFPGAPGGGFPGAPGGGFPGGPPPQGPPPPSDNGDGVGVVGDNGSGGGVSRPDIQAVIAEEEEMGVAVPVETAPVEVDNRGEYLGYMLKILCLNPCYDKAF